MDLIVGIILIFLAVFLIAIVVMNVKIVPQSKAYVIERLGAYSALGRRAYMLRSLSLSALQSRSRSKSR